VSWGFESPPCYWKTEAPQRVTRALLLCRGRSVVLVRALRCSGDRSVVLPPTVSAVRPGAGRPQNCDSAAGASLSLGTEASATANWIRKRAAIWSRPAVTQSLAQAQRAVTQIRPAKT
jgi:hypothetical protein